MYSGAAYGPETLNAMARALETAWAQAQACLAGLSAEDYLPDMAASVLEAAARGERNPERLRQAALRGLGGAISLSRH